MKQEIIIANAPRGSSVVLDGKRVEHLTDIELHHRAGDLPRLTLEMRGVDVTVLGEGNVTWLFGGETFTADDVLALRESPPDEPALSDIADRLARAMGLE
jgi:hypothetical protein